MTAHEFLIALGLIFLLGLATDYLGKRSFLPRITLLILFGIVIGDNGLALLPASLTGNFELFTNIAMMMIGFLLGGKMTRRFLRSTGMAVFAIATCAAIGSALLVSLGLYLFGVPPEICVILGCISAATDPAATTEAIRETGIHNRFTRMLFAVVALDDLIGILLFGIGISIVSVFSADGMLMNTLTVIAWELVGAFLLGLFIGLPASVVTGRIKEGEPILMEALGLVFLCGGLALWLEVSIIIAALTLGAVISNCARHHQYPFHAIEDIEWPFMVLFFTLAGASLDISRLAVIGLIGAVFVVSRTFGKFSGAYAGAVLARGHPSIRNWSGLAMLPQAGIAMGMALIASRHYPQHSQLILSVVISTTVLFEITGPVVTRYCVKRASSSRELEVTGTT